MERSDTSDPYRYMVEHSRDIMFLLDNEGIFVFLNEGVESVLGFEKQDLIGKHYSELVYPDDVIYASFVFDVYKNNYQEELLPSIELRFRCKNIQDDSRYFDINLVNVLCNKTGLSQMETVPDYGGGLVIYYGVARDITQRKLLENIINTNANYDSLTGLPNRVLLNEHMRLAIAHAKRENYKFAIMFFDLDGFKQVNDIYGHSVGDVLLRKLANRLQACLREGDTLAGWAGMSSSCSFLKPII